VGDCRDDQGSMIGRHQLRLLVRSGRLGPAMGLLIASILIASITGLARFRTESNAAAAYDRQAREHIARNQEIARGIERRIAAGEEKELIPPPFGSRAPNYVHTWCHPAAVLPPGPLAWMTVGESDLNPHAYSGPGMTAAEINSNPLLLSNGSFDLTQVIGQILPIVIVLLMFDLAVGERENSVLSMALAQPVSFRRLLLLSSVPAVLFVLGTTVLLIGGAAALSGTTAFARLALWLGAVVTYAIFWLALALLVNSARLSPPSAAATLAGAWLLLNVLVPTAANAVANGVYPAPPRPEYVAVERELPERIAKLSSIELVREYSHHHPEYGNLTHLDYQGYRYVVGHAMAEARAALLDLEESRIQEQRRKQDRLAALLSTASPAALLLRFMTEVSGSGHTRREAFLLQKKQHLADYNRFFRPRIYALPNSVFRSSDYDKIPTFHYREETLAEVWARASAPGGLLVAFALLTSAAVAYRLTAFRY